MNLNEKLHLTIPVYAADGQTITAYAHSVPISREVYRAHFKIIAKTFASIHGDGYGALAGPAMAALLLEDVAKESGASAEALALLNEIRRLTNLLVSTPGGWVTVPFEQAAGAKIGQDDIDGIENAIVFFTVVSSMHRKMVAIALMQEAARIWGAQISSLDCTAFAGSLKTLTVGANSGATAPAASSVIS